MARLRESIGGLWLRGILLLAIGFFYFWTAVPEWHPGMIGRSGQGYYNLLTRGFMKGTLSLDTPADPLLASMKNPSDPAERGDHGLHDASYFHGHYYLYFGATPVVVLFLPFRLLTGRFIDETVASPLFAFIGLAMAVWLVMAVRRKYFSGSGWWVAAGCVLGLGLADMMPILLRRSSVWEVAITCAYACFMAALIGLFRSLEGRRRAAWLAMASAAMGLAVASRPTYLFGCGAILVPLAAFGWERRRDGAGFRDPAWWRFALCGIVPLAAVGMVMALYNYERFGSPLDFGFRHLMNGEPVWKEDLFSLRFFWYNFRVYAFAPAHWSPYFPFVSVARLPRSPLGHLGSEDPYGIIPNVPFALLAAIAMVFAACRSAWSTPLRLFCAAAAIGVVGTGLATTSFGGAINRYEEDFLPGIMVLACIAWLGIATCKMPMAARALLGFLVSALVAFSSVFSVLASLRHNELLRVEHPALYRAMAHRWNRLSALYDTWSGTRYGPVEIKLIFPQDKIGQTEPLVVTGCSFMSDYLVVHYEGQSHVSFALEHSSYGQFRGKTVRINPGTVHTVDVEMGSLYPPTAHPFFDTLTPVEAELCARTLKVTLDGDLVLQREIPFYDATSRQPSIGLSDDRPGYGQPFSGTIVSWRRLPIDLTEAEKGPVSLKILFPPFNGTRGEPLVSTGVAGRGDLVYVRYEGPDRISFGYDHYGTGGNVSFPITVDPAAAHTLDIDSDALYGGRVLVGTEQTGRLSLRLDGRRIFYGKVPYFAATPQSTAIGMNAVGSSAAVEMFRGQILETKRPSVAAFSKSEGAYGPFELELQMPRGVTRPQPLVTTGRTGLGDTLWIKWVAPGRARLGYDDWGSGLVESADFAMSPDAEHVMRVSMPSLLSPGATPSEKILNDTMSVVIDGVLVWAQRVSYHPATPAEAYVGSNGIGSSSCDAYFAGGIASFERTDPAPAAAPVRGALLLRLTLPTASIGSAEPLVTIGRTGRADVLLVHLLDDHHISFAIDHWGGSYRESGPIGVDYRPLHDLEIRMPNLEPSRMESEVSGEADIRLDGARVWQVTEGFYLSAVPVAIGSNPIGASTCSPEFTGALMTVPGNGGP